MKAELLRSPRPLEEEKRVLDGWSTRIPLGTEVIDYIFEVGWIDREL